VTPAVSADFVARLAALEAEFKAQAEGGSGETAFNFWFTESQMLDMASGYVPVSIRAAMMAALDWAEEDRRRAGRPVQPPRRRTQGPDSGVRAQESGCVVSRSIFHSRTYPANSIASNGTSSWPWCGKRNAASVSVERSAVSSATMVARPVMLVRY